MATMLSFMFTAANIAQPLLQDLTFEIADKTFNSRLILGSGKYTDNEAMVKSLEVSGTEMVTVALRRVNMSDTDDSAYIHHIDREKYLFLPNTAGTPALPSSHSVAAIEPFPLVAASMSER